MLFPEFLPLMSFRVVAPVPCDGGSPVLEYNLEMVAPDSDRRQVYQGKETYCSVAG